MKPKIIILIPILIIFLLVIGGLIYFLVFLKPAEKPPVSEEKNLEELLKSLTVPEGAEIEPLSPAVLRDLSVPKNVKIKPLSPDAIKSLTVPE